ncbi:YybH family protein [Gymnodinialimonas hymeniacidonis]|uniref:YybH family protein n=1 Tax=Gymnodinialimonas hymeniacidonis TaxID=3126508 RepID=UPI0034C5E08F
MTPQEFVNQYEAALGTQDWAQVAPLIAEKATVIFSNGVLLDGKDAVRAAYERNFAMIENEDFRIEDVCWLMQTEDSAAYMFEFHWAGIIDGRSASGAGRGTTVLRRFGDRWMLVGEQLGPTAA